MNDTISLLLKIVTENPAVSAAIAGAIVSIVAFFKPIMAALQRALIRRIDQAWPDSTIDYEEKVKRTVDVVSKGLPVSKKYVEGEIRKHKSNPPPGKK